MCIRDRFITFFLFFFIHCGLFSICTSPLRPPSSCPRRLKCSPLPLPAPGLRSVSLNLPIFSFLNCFFSDHVPLPGWWPWGPLRRQVVPLLFLSFYLLLSGPGSPGWLPRTTLLLLLLLALYEHPSEFPFSLLPLWFLLLFLMFLWFLSLV